MLLENEILIEILMTDNIYSFLTEDSKSLVIFTLEKVDYYVTLSNIMHPIITLVGKIKQIYMSIYTHKPSGPVAIIGY